MLIGKSTVTNNTSSFAYIIRYCCPVKLFKQNKLGLTLLTKYQPFWLSLFLLN